MFSVKYLVGGACLHFKGLLSADRIFKGIPVSVVAEGMMQDALLYLAKAEVAASAPEVVIYDNSGIRRLVQVR